MRFTRTALNNRVTTSVAIIVLVLAGLSAYFEMPRDEDPGFIIRFAQIVTRYPGANPERMELLVSDKIEKAVQEMPELKNVFSENRTGVSIVLVEIKPQYREMRPIWDKLRRKINDIRGQLPSGVIGPQVSDRIKPWLEQKGKTWAHGTRWELGGKDKAANEGNQSINEKLPIAGFIILMLLVSQFNGLRKPLIIFTTIPLAFIGVVLGLLITGSYMGFMTLLGIVSLAGIVINNAIVLLDRIRIEMEDNGLSARRAIVTAAQVRLRPILLTTVTTVGGLIPLWLGGGPMWEPMAIAIIFGLLFSTALTLGFVPLIYALLHRVKFKGFEYN